VLDHPLAAGGADPGRQLGVVEQPADGGGERLGLPGGTCSAVTPSGPTTSGRRPAVVATSGVAQAISSTAGRLKPS
jgi:hypothetical protein